MDEIYARQIVDQLRELNKNLEELVNLIMNKESENGA